MFLNIFAASFTTKGLTSIILLHGKVEEGIGIRLVLQGEVPPLALIRFEAMFYHDTAQQKTVLLMLLRDDISTDVGTKEHRVRGLAKVVEVTAHIDLLARLTVADGHVDGATLGMSRLTGDVLGEQALFLLRGIIVSFVALVGGL